MEFKIGDKVRIIENRYLIHRKGEYAKIIKIMNVEGLYQIYIQNKGTYSFYSHELEKLVKNNKLNKKLYPNHIEEENYLIVK